MVQNRFQFVLRRQIHRRAAVERADHCWLNPISLGDEDTEG